MEYVLSRRREYACPSPVRGASDRRMDTSLMVAPKAATTTSWRARARVALAFAAWLAGCAPTADGGSGPPPKEVLDTSTTPVDATESVDGGCVPNCTERTCGSDGCGGSCGTCESGLNCNAAMGRCLPPTCGNDSVVPCEGGTCERNSSCTADGACLCNRGWQARRCDGSPCTESSPCGAGEWECVQCTPNCAGRTCGDDGCGGTCGTCEAGLSCDNAAGVCLGPRCGNDDSVPCGDGTNCQRNSSCTADNACECNPGWQARRCDGSPCTESSPCNAGDWQCVALGDGGAPDGGARDASAIDAGARDASCAPESDAAFCSRLRATCGTRSAADNCGTTRRVTCGTCPAGRTCNSSGQCVVSCVAESNAAFCSRLRATCGTRSAADNCGTTRRVNCGTCPSGRTCNSSGQCVVACVPESNAAFCGRYRASCLLSANDNCGTTRQVNCGTCASGQVCMIGECISMCLPRGSNCRTGTCCSGRCQCVSHPSYTCTCV